MIDEIIAFFYMNGHGWYVWSAYVSVFCILTIQWLVPWRAWKAAMVSKVIVQDE